MDRNVQRSVDARDAEDDESYEATLRAAENSKILAALGPPGSGKTAAVHACIDHWKARGARILLALPTGQLAAEMRARHPDVDVDTCHGAFLFHKDLNEALPILTQYDLVVVDELSMLTAEHMGRLDAMRRTADQLPCLVMLGDFWQLPGPQKNSTKVSDSAAWRQVKTLEFTGNHRCQDPKLAKKLAALRTSVPSQKLLGSCNWFKHWQLACIQSGLKHEEGLPLLPAPCRGGWARVPLPAHEGAVLLKQILISAGIEKTDLCNVGTQSLKVTGLSWSARYGLPLDVRRQLGYHVGPNEKMTLLYSRDAAASPLRQFESVLAAIRSNAFHPDMTRSGYFVTARPSDVVEVHDDEEPPGPKQGNSSSSRRLLR